MIELTREYMRAQAARAVPGAEFDGRAWVLPEPTPRSAVVALKLFPELMHRFPELVELRDSVIQDAKPVDYATQCGIRIGAPRVRAAMAGRGWSLSAAKAQPIDAGPDYQEIDLGYIAAVLKQHKAAFLAWSRGLGKTLGAAALIDELGCDSTVIITPNSSKSVTWADELEWALPEHSVYVLPNDAKKRASLLDMLPRLDPEDTPFVLVVHYEALAVIAGVERRTGKSARILDGWKRLGIEWDLVVADEGHRLSNPDTNQSRAAAKLRALSDMALIETGSVFQNRWEEMFGMLKFLFPDRYRSRWRDWNNRYLDYVENGYGKICVGLLEHKIEDMRDELGRFMVVRDKKNLAKPTEVRVPLSPEQRRVYEDLAETMLAELPNGERIKASVGVALLTRLRQVATGLDLLAENVQDSSKIDACVDVIKKYWDRGDDYVVFGWYRASMRALAKRLAEAGIESWVIDGDVPMKERTRIVRAFQAGEKRVLLGTMSTMSESINLQRANHVVRIDRSFNPATNEQSTDRVDRQGQTRPVYLTDIIAERTVDDLVVLPTLANKSALRAIVFGDPTQVQRRAPADVPHEGRRASHG